MKKITGDTKGLDIFTKILANTIRIGRERIRLLNEILNYLIFS